MMVDADPLYLGSVDDFEGRERFATTVGGREVFVFRLGEAFYAYENRCPHMGGPVGRGKLVRRVETVVDDEGCVLEERFSETDVRLACPWHGWEFDLETGVCPVDTHLRLRRYDVVRRGDKIYVLA